MGKLDTDKFAFWVTFIFIIVSPLENILRTEQIVYAVGIMALGFCIFRKGMLVVNNSKYIIFLMIYMFFACYWSTEKQALNLLPVVYAELIFLYFQLQFFYTESQYRKIKIAFLIQNWILLILCFTNGTYMDSRFWLKSATSGADPNYLSGWFVIPLCFAVDFLFSKEIKKIWKGVIIAQVVLSVYFIMQTASKSGLITNACVMAIATIYTSRKMIKDHPGYALAIIVLFIAGSTVAINNMPVYLVQRLTNGDMTGTGRFPMWITLIKEMLNNPIKMIFGFGTGAVKYYTGKGLVSHNTYLDFLFNYGVIGFSTLIIFVAKSIRIKLKNCPYSVISFCGMSVLLFTLSAFSTRFFMSVLFLIGLDITSDSLNIMEREEDMELYG